MQRRVAVCRRAASAGAMLAMVLCVSSAARAEGSQPVKAVWQVQEIHLAYMGFTSKYSCDGMRDRVAGWMNQLGAQDSSLVRIAGCDRLSGPATLPSVMIVLATPVAATPEAMAANAQDKKRSELLARLQTKGKPALVDGTFDATRKSVVLLSKERMDAGSAGDCELLENLRDQVLKKIDAHVTKDRLGCTPHQGTVGNPQLEVEVLAKV